jgi:hemerythrin-like domain-containing protein
VEKGQIIDALHALRPLVIQVARRRLSTESIEPVEEVIKTRLFQCHDCKEDLLDWLQHLLSMLDRGEQFVHEDRLDKAMRFLACVQGSLMTLGGMSIHQGQGQNRKKD